MTAAIARMTYPLPGGHEKNFLSRAPCVDDEKQSTTRTTTSDGWSHRENDMDSMNNRWVSKRNLSSTTIEFLDSPLVLDIEKAKAALTLAQWIVYLFCVLLRPAREAVRIIARFPQKSKQWLWARMGRLTGSMAAAAVGHHRYAPPLTKVREILSEFKRSSNPLMDWGSGKELYAGSAYIASLNEDVAREYRKQRLAAAQQYGVNIKANFHHFLFRNQWIPVPADLRRDPTVEIRHFGLLIGMKATWRGMSPDGIVFINDIAVGCIEIKCSYKNQYSLYPNMYDYYYDQLMCELYLSQEFWSSAQWLDFINWTPDGFTVDEYLFDKEYFYTWYLPRESRFWFAALFPTLVNSLKERWLKVFATTLSVSNRLSGFFCWLQTYCSCPVTTT